MASCGVHYEYQSNVLSGILLQNSASEADVGSTDELGGALSLDTTTDLISRSSSASADKTALIAPDASLFLLEPPINDLLAYDNSFELQGRRNPVSAELRNILYVETQKARLLALVTLFICCKRIKIFIVDAYILNVLSHYFLCTETSCTTSRAQ